MDEKTNVVNRYKIMGREKMTGDYQKTRSVIMSCDNWDQLKVGIKMYNQLNKLHELPEKDLDKLENLIGLMKIKCKNVSSYDVLKKVDERSSVGDTFHKAAQQSGVQDLKSVVFSEEEELKLAITTWPKGITPIVHYSESKALHEENDKLKPQAHSDYINNVPNLYGTDVAVMVEAKAKELAILPFINKVSKLIKE